MRHPLAILFYPTLLACLILQPACGGGGGGGGAPASNTSSPVPGNLTSVDEIVAEAVTSGLDAVLVYIDQPGSESAYAAGISDRSSRESASSHSLFKIASISKLFIAVASAMLIDQGVLQQDDSIALWLPELAVRINNAESITVRLLVKHRSGVPDFDSQSGFRWTDAHTDIDRTLTYALDLPADFTPDARYEYSNTNYLLLAKILDRALGYSHRNYIQDNILTPLDMTDTYAQLNDVDTALLMQGYWDGIDRTRQDYVIPGGSMVSTVQDVAKFVGALNRGELLSDSTQSIYSSLYEYGHSGWLPGYQSIAGYHKDIDAVVVQFVNTTGGNSENLARTSYDEIVRLLKR